MLLGAGRGLRDPSGCTWERLVRLANKDRGTCPERAVAGRAKDRHAQTGRQAQRERVLVPASRPPRFPVAGCSRAGGQHRVAASLPGRTRNTGNRGRAVLLGWGAGATPSTLGLSAAESRASQAQTPCLALPWDPVPAGLSVSGVAPCPSSSGAISLPFPGVSVMKGLAPGHRPR